MTGTSRRSFLKTLGVLSGLGVGGSGLATVRDGNESGGQTSPGRQSTQFVGTWTASPQAPYSEGVSQTGFTDQSVRMMSRTSVGGQQIRIRLSNAFGDDPVTFERTSVGIRAEEGTAAIESGTLRIVTFGGDEAITIPPGGRIISDPIELRVEPEQDVATTLYAAEPTGPTTWHALPTKTSYLSTAGDYTGTTAADAFETEAQQWFFLEGIDVLSPETNGSIACLGNSITDGFNSTVDANAAYPDVLAERVNEQNSLKKSVINAGISGNRVLNDSACCGVNALARFDRDVLTQTGVTDVILLEGINDIGFEKLDGEATQPATSVTAADIIDGYQQLIRRAHSEGVRIIGGTLTPFKGADYYYEEGEAKRQEVNEYIRTSGAFDGIVDFDAAIRDPDNPKRILPKYDSGDNLHPNDAGYRAMAEAIDLKLFQSRGRAERGAENKATGNS